MTRQLGRHMARARAPRVYIYIWPRLSLAECVYHYKVAWSVCFVCSIRRCKYIVGPRLCACTVLYTCFDGDMYIREMENRNIIDMGSREFFFCVMYMYG